MQGWQPCVQMGNRIINIEKYHKKMKLLGEE